MCMRTSIAVLRKELLEILNVLVYVNKRHFIIHLVEANCGVSWCFFGVSAHRVPAGMALWGSQQGLAEHGGDPSNFRAGTRRAVTGVLAVVNVGN